MEPRLSYVRPADTVEGKFGKDVKRWEVAPTLFD